MAAYNYGDQENVECNGIWMSWDFWCACVGWSDNVCAEAEEDMEEVWSSAQWMMIKSAREETKKLGGKKGMKPATFKKLVHARLTKEKED